MLNKCEREDCNPVEQIRGEMGPGDYADVMKTHAFVPPWDSSTSVTSSSASKLHQLVEMNDSLRNDFRICCMTCGRVTGWNKRDAPGMPGAGADYTRKLWNDGIR